MTRIKHVARDVGALAGLALLGITVLTGMVMLVAILIAFWGDMFEAAIRWLQ